MLSNIRMEIYIISMNKIEILAQPRSKQIFDPSL